MDELEKSDFKKLYEEAMGLSALDQIEWDPDYLDYYFEDWDDDELDFIYKSEEQPAQIKKVDLSNYIPKRLAEDADYYETYKVRGCWLRYGDYLGWIEGNSVSEIVSNLHMMTLNSLINDETRRNIHLMV